jgi:SAM-dependent methyltransferase
LAAAALAGAAAHASIASAIATLRTIGVLFTWRAPYPALLGGAPVYDPATMRFPGRELASLLDGSIPSDHARQSVAEAYIGLGVGRPSDRPWRVLDLGCGPGFSVDVFRMRDPNVDWVGLDLPDSPEVRTRTRTDARFETFDGVTIPFEDGSFDTIYCKQVLEHVRRPAALLAEVRRVLEPGGFLAGSTSQLEPFHSLSLWNYTPLGFAELIDEAGLTVVELRPGIDVLTLIGWRVLGPRRCFERWWGGQSPLNRVIDAYGRFKRLDATALNATKLVFCAQFAFLVRRPE